MASLQIRARINEQMGKLSYLLIVIFAIFLLSACAALPDPETRQMYAADAVIVLETGQSAGQTFRARRPGLVHIQFNLEAEAGTQLTVALFASPDETHPIYSTRLRVNPGWNSLQLEQALDNLADQSYFLRFSDPEKSVILKGRAEDSYTGGNSYFNQSPLAADLAFQTSYQYGAAALGQDLLAGLRQWWLLLPLALSLLLPGWLLLDFSGLRRRFDFGETVALALAFSLSLVPLLLVWTSLISLPWHTAAVWGLAVLLILLLAWKLFRRGQLHWQSNAATWPAMDLPPAENSLPLNLLLIGIFLAAWILRAAMVRDLAAPAWVDSVHHTLITRLILETGRLPSDLSAYLLPGVYQYHPGFHSSLAAFLSLSGLPIPAGMLFFGQALNALIVFPVYAFAKTLTRSPLAGVLAALLVGFFSPMPAYYASWGRYTQLTGLLILPAGLLLMERWVVDPTDRSTRRRYLLLTGLVLAGVFLHHYRVTAFLGVLLLVYFPLQHNWRSQSRLASFLEVVLGSSSLVGLSWLLGLVALFWIGSYLPQEQSARILGSLLLVYLALQLKWRTLPGQAGKLAVAVLAGMLLALPWLLPTLQDLLIPKAQGWAGNNREWVDFSTHLLLPAAGRQTLILAAIGLGIAGLRRQRFAFSLPLWVLLLWVLANLGGFGLPNPGFVNGLSVEITLFLPIVTLGGYALSQLAAGLDGLFPKPSRLVVRCGLLALGLAAAVWGAQRLLPTLNPSTFLYQEGDTAALAWIDTNLPHGQAVLINPTGWGYGIYAGQDGGFWISALSDHPTYPPPVLYGSGDSEHRAELNALIEQVIAAGQSADALANLMRTQQIEYIYLGARGGQFSAQNLQASAQFELLYTGQGTWLFKLSP